MAWKSLFLPVMVVLPILAVTLVGCAPTKLVDVPEILEPPRLPLRVGLYISPNVRHQTETIGIVKFDVGQIIETVVLDQCRRAFLAVTPVHHFPWSPEEVKGLDVIMVIDRPSKVKGWISGLTQWTAEGTGTLSIYSPANKLLFQDTETSAAKLNVDPLGGNELIKEVSHEGQRIVTHALVSQILNKFSRTGEAMEAVRKAKSNRIAAEKSDGRVSPASVTRQKPSKPFKSQMPTAKSAQKGAHLSSIAQNWAVIIGISKYKYSGQNGLTNLIFADDDAKAFARVLRHLGWSESHIKLLLNEETTKRNIEIALESWLSKAGPNDQVILFWAGHGFPDPEDPEKVYFACYDTDISIPATGYRMDRVRAVLEEKRARNVIVLADTCHAGKLISRGERGISIVPQIDKMHREQKTPKGWVFMVGADTDRKAIEHTSWSNGAFTHCLIDALYGKADGYLSSGAEDGIVTMGELRSYMNTAMPDETQRVLGVAKRPIITTSTGDPDIWNLTFQAK